MPHQLWVVVAALVALGVTPPGSEAAPESQPAAADPAPLARDARQFDNTDADPFFEQPEMVDWNTVLGKRGLGRFSAANLSKRGLGRYSAADMSKRGIGRYSAAMLAKRGLGRYSAANLAKRFSGYVQPFDQNANLQDWASAYKRSFGSHERTKNQFSEGFGRDGFQNWRAFFDTYRHGMRKRDADPRD